MDQASWSRAVTRVRPARFSGIPVWWARRKCCWENFQKWSGNTPRCSFLPWSLSSWGIIQVFFCQGKFAAYLPHGLQAFSSKLGEGRGDRFMAHATRVPIACTGLSRASEIRKHLEQTQVTHIKCQGKRERSQETPIFAGHLRHQKSRHQMTNSSLQGRLLDHFQDECPATRFLLGLNLPGGNHPNETLSPSKLASCISLA